MRRRTFLGSAIGLLAARGARAADPAPEVVVIGGGPAGLSAALELAERGVSVTLFEAGSRLGGKATGWTDQLGGERVDVEHGIHGWWHQYVHFHDLLERYALSEGLRPAKRSENGLRGADGSEWSSYVERASAFISRSKARGHGFFPTAYRKGLRWIRGQDLAGIRGDLGGRSVADWVADKDVPLTVFSVYDRLMAHSMYFRAPEVVDAAEYVEGERFYFSGSSKNDKVQWLKGNPDALVWTPLANALMAHGGTIERATPVAGLAIENGRVMGVRIGRPAAEVHIDGPIDAWRSVELDGDKVWVGPGEQGPVAYSARCTHQGCAIDRAEKGFLCPCHGGRFDEAGQPVAGPPEHALTSLRVLEDGSGYRVLRKDTRRLVFADWVVLAVDVPALQHLAGQALPSVNGLKACREVVARFWFDRDVRQANRSAVLIEGFPHGSNAFLVHRLQDASAAWAAETGGSVIELQAYRGWSGDESDAQIVELLEAELRRLFPELLGASVLKTHLTVGDRFTWFHPGWREHASPVQSEVDRLLIAGDHVHLPRSEVQFMERAVLSGRMAANLVLRATGRKPAAILEPR